MAKRDSNANEICNGNKRNGVMAKWQRNGVINIRNDNGNDK